MHTLTIQKITEVTGGTYFGSDASRERLVKGAVRDNREVKPDNMFVCICGEHTDGHLYANSAFEAGASCCLTEKEIPNAKGSYIKVPSSLESIKTIAAYHRQQFDIPIIGITGSVGKTTAKELVASALSAKLCVLKTDKNLNNELGVPLTLLSLAPQHEAAVIEMGISDFGEMTRLAQMVVPDIFVMTSIGYSHIKELGDLNGVLRAKTEAFACMSKDAVAVLNGDDTLLRGYEPGMKKLLFGLGDNCDFRAQNVKANGIESVSMDISTKSDRYSVTLPAYGSHLAVLVPAAAAVGELLGLKGTEIARGLCSYTHVEGRSNVSNAGGITLVNDCYNANPNSTEAALASLSQLHGRRVAILGDMLNLGSLSKELHYGIGAAAARYGIELLLCQGNASHDIVDGYLDNGGTCAEHYESLDLLMKDLPARIKKRDAVLVKASRSLRFEKILPIISCLSS